MKVLIIPEDPTHDQFILRPVIEKIFEDVERRARVEVLTDPHLSGVSQAMDPAILRGIIADNRTFDLFLLLVDQDCVSSRLQSLREREQEHEGRLLTCLGIQEVEVWLLALYRDELETPWSSIREHCNPKEQYAWPLLERKGWHLQVGRGYKRAMRDLGHSYRGLLEVCPELKEFKERLTEWLKR